MGVLATVAAAASVPAKLLSGGLDVSTGVLIPENRLGGGVAMAELSSEEGGTGPPDGDLPLDVRQRLHDQMPFALPVIAIVPVVIAVILASTLAPVRAGAAALGAAGWLVAIALRVPAIAFVLRMPKLNTPKIMAPFLALISGPVEELIRLLLVLFGVKGFGSVLWAGFGWAAIEVVYTLVNALVLRRLLLDTSASAAGARRLLVSMGILQYVQCLVPLLGAVERAGVSLLHIGFTLLLGWNPWLMLLTMPTHSATNLCAVRLIKKRSVILMETIVVAVGATAFALGLLAWQH